MNTRLNAAARHTQIQLPARTGDALIASRGSVSQEISRITKNKG